MKVSVSAFSARIFLSKPPTWQEAIMNRIIWFVGAVVIILFILSYLGFR